MIPAALLNLQSPAPSALWEPLPIPKPPSHSPSPTQEVSPGNTPEMVDKWEGKRGKPWTLPKANWGSIPIGCPEECLQWIPGLSQGSWGPGYSSSDSFGSLLRISPRKHQIHKTSTLSCRAEKPLGQKEAEKTKGLGARGGKLSTCRNHHLHYRWTGR